MGLLRAAVTGFPGTPVTPGRSLPVSGAASSMPAVAANSGLYL